MLVELADPVVVHVDLAAVHAGHAVDLVAVPAVHAAAHVVAHVAAHVVVPVARAAVLAAHVDRVLHAAPLVAHADHADHVLNPAVVLAVHARNPAVVHAVHVDRARRVVPVPRAALAAEIV